MFRLSDLLKTGLLLYWLDKDVYKVLALHTSVTGAHTNGIEMVRVQDDSG